MQIALIAAMANNRVIGFNNQMPWHMPADLAHFKKITLDHVIVMGRKTFESIKRPLPGRRNIVITRQRNLNIPGVLIFHSLDDALDSLQQEPEIMIIGGQTLFERMLPNAHKMYLTMIDADVLGDTFFPQWNQNEWQITARELHQADNRNPYDYQFLEYKRLSNGVVES